MQLQAQGRRGKALGQSQHARFCGVVLVGNRNLTANLSFMVWRKSITATSEELISLSGVAQKVAGQIMAGRPYSSVDDLMKVKGIKKTKLGSVAPFRQRVGQSKQLLARAG